MKTARVGTFAAIIACVWILSGCSMLDQIIGVNETIRASMYIYNTKDEIDRFVDVIKETTLEKCVDSIL